MSSGQFAELPAELAREKSYTVFARQLKEHLYREASLKLLRCESLDSTSKPDESEADFRKRLEPLLGEAMAAEKTSWKRQYATKLSDADEQVQVGRSQGQHADAGSSLPDSARCSGSSSTR